MRRVAERGAKAAEQKAEFDVRYAVAARLKLEIEAVDAEERDVQQAEADNALAKAKVEAAENDAKEWRKRRVQVAAARTRGCFTQFRRAFADGARGRVLL